MIDRKSQPDKKKFDAQEFELPETVFIRDIDNRVFQGIVLQVLSAIEGISLAEGNFINHIFGGSEGVKGITTEQDSKNRSVNVKIEINIQYGISIPAKAEEIQTKTAEEITRLTGLHVSCVHVVVKNVVLEGEKKLASPLDAPLGSRAIGANLEEEYSDEF